MEIRNPKAEIRSPKATDSCRPFGFRASDFFRISDFGLRISLCLLPIWLLLALATGYLMIARGPLLWGPEDSE